MRGPDSTELEALLFRIKSQAAGGNFRITQHAQQEMVEDEISLDEVLEAIRQGEILEHYPEHRRGACCLLCGLTDKGRPLHIVCTTAQPVLILITAYEPRPPRWRTPRERRSQL
jgi:hypothetical protein